jgi:hypothetical protein
MREGRVRNGQLIAYRAEKIRKGLEPQRFLTFSFEK